LWDFSGVVELRPFLDQVRSTVYKLEAKLFSKGQSTLFIFNLFEFFWRGIFEKFNLICNSSLNCYGINKKYGNGKRFEREKMNN